LPRCRAALILLSDSGWYSVATNVKGVARAFPNRCGLNLQEPAFMYYVIMSVLLLGAVGAFIYLKKKGQ
jgi:hypothetical protein